MLIFRTRKKKYMSWRNPSTWAEAVGKVHQTRYVGWWDRACMLDYGIVIWGRGGVLSTPLSFLFRLFYLALLSDHVCVRANLCVRIVVQSRSPFFSLSPILFLEFHLPSLELPFDFGVTLHGEKKKKWKRPWTLCHPQRTRSEIFFFLGGGGI